MENIHCVMHIHCVMFQVIPSSSYFLTINIERQEHENFGFGLSNTLHSSHAGCYIKAVGKNSPADRAGLKKYDKLVQVGYSLMTWYYQESKVSS